MKMSIESFLNNLHKVKPQGRNKWVALCPCHDDKNPSLAISDDNGIVLIHCFGCGANAVEVAHKLGVDLSELFPPKSEIDYDKTGQKYQFNNRQVLKALYSETLVSYVILKGIADDPIASQVKDRLLLSISRISAAIDYIENI